MFRLSKAAHRGADDREAFLGKLPSLRPIDMLLDLTEGTVQWSVQVLPLELLRSHAIRDAAVLNPQCHSAVSIGIEANTYTLLAVELEKPTPVKF